MEVKFAAIQDETLRERADDILDLARRVLRQLEGADAFGLGAMPADSVLVTQWLLPSDVVALSPRDVKAIVVESFGQGSHAALLTREKGIPTLAGLPELLSQIRSGGAVTGFSSLHDELPNLRRSALEMIGSPLKKFGR